MISNDQDDGGDHETGQVFSPGMAIGMPLICRLSGNAGADQSDACRKRVRHVVGSVCDYGNRVDRKAQDDFDHTKHTVHEDPHGPGQSRIAGPDFRILIILIVFYEMLPEKFFH